jgi:hypothetical protein
VRGLILIILLAWIALAASPYALLVRADAIEVGGENPPIIEDVACIYFAGLEFRTVILIDQTAGARCSVFRQFGALF